MTELNKAGDSGKSLIKLRSGQSSRPPIFFVHPLHGHALCFAPLSVLLGDRQPVFAFQSKGLSEGYEPVDSIPVMAREYVDALLKEQKEGPYFLAGYSLGVCIALEMACILKSLGKEVARIFFIDLRLGERERMDTELISLLFLLQDSFRMEIFHEYKNLDDIQKVGFLLEHAYKEGKFPPTLERGRAKRMVAVYFANGKASASYIPEILEKVKGMPVTYFFSTQLPTFVAKGGDEYAELFAKENERKRTTPDAYFVEGCSHFNILEMPFVKQLAEHMASEIKKVQESYGIQ